MFFNVTMCKLSIAGNGFCTGTIAFNGEIIAIMQQGSMRQSPLVYFFIFFSSSRFIELALQVCQIRPEMPDFGQTVQIRSAG